MRREQGAVAVEMALLLPVLILLLLGIMEFGRAFDAQVTLTNAAREGVRVMAISKDAATARSSTVTAAGTLRPQLTDANIAISVPGATTANPCPAGGTATVTITYTLSTLTKIAGPFSMTGKGVMLCGG
ncbi:pilus assembly protein [Arthrobacter sp. NamB2]|uniref:TadE/TadG family type IV pilus assembly protein n=1 Tax=Arthrobacter sp. NamB2 TaxID=2576035 RepID=UPI0010C96170|nr:TadE/TadG family type IV pilus assembly protein [Arthrobacter sp. NamB2]TKV29510.1 pilus assembly protein [Arthrobacter sp. NamB2]